MYRVIVSYCNSTLTLTIIIIIFEVKLFNILAIKITAEEKVHHECLLQPTKQSQNLKCMLGSLLVLR